MRPAQHDVLLRGNQKRLFGDRLCFEYWWCFPRVRLKLIVLFLKVTKSNVRKIKMYVLVMSTSDRRVRSEAQSRQVVTDECICADAHSDSERPDETPDGRKERCNGKRTWQLGS